MYVNLVGSILFIINKKVCAYLGALQDGNEISTLKFQGMCTNIEWKGKDIPLFVFINIHYFT